jgi:hypothetical protein
MGRFKPRLKIFISLFICKSVHELLLKLSRQLRKAEDKLLILCQHILEDDFLQGKDYFLLMRMDVSERISTIQSTTRAQRQT